MCFGGEREILVVSTNSSLAREKDNLSQVNNFLNSSIRELTFLAAVKGAYTLENPAISVNRADCPTNDAYPTLLFPAALPFRLMLYSWNRHCGVMDCAQVALTADAAFTRNSSSVAAAAVTASVTHLDTPPDASPWSSTSTCDARARVAPNRVVGCTKLMCAATSAGTEYRVVRSSGAPEPASPSDSCRYQAKVVSSMRPAVAASVRKKRYSPSSRTAVTLWAPSQRRAAAAASGAGRRRLRSSWPS